jgi:hypothetical protein
MVKPKQFNFTATESKTIYDMRKSGLTVNDISALFPKRSLDTIKQKLSRMGFSIVDAIDVDGRTTTGGAK